MQLVAITDPASINHPNERKQVNEYQLYPNNPNPFNSYTTIEFFIPKESHVRLAVFNVLGQELTILIDSDLPAGLIKTQWDGKDRFGNSLGSGVYIIQIKAGNFTATQKVMLLR